MGIYIVHPGTGTIISATDEAYLVSVDVEGVDIDEDDDSALIEYAVAHGLLFDPVVLDRVWPETSDTDRKLVCSACNKEAVTLSADTDDQAGDWCLFCGTTTAVWIEA